MLYRSFPFSRVMHGQGKYSNPPNKNNVGSDVSKVDGSGDKPPQSNCGGTFRGFGPRNRQPQQPQQQQGNDYGPPTEPPPLTSLQRLPRPVITTAAAPAPCAPPYTPYTIPNAINYPSFPAEIRRMIMRFALQPGYVHPPYARSGVQLLAANREHYEEGHVIYYSKNVFHIPRKVEDLELLRKYRSKHLSLIRRVKLTLSIIDVYEELVQDIVANSLPREVSERCQIASNLLREIWYAKFHAITQLFPHLEELHIVFPGPHFFGQISHLPPAGFWTGIPTIPIALWPFSTENWPDFDHFRQRYRPSLTIEGSKIRKMLEAFESANSGTIFNQSPSFQGPDMTFPMLLKEAVQSSQTHLSQKYYEVGGWENFMIWLGELVERQKNLRRR